MLASTYKHGKTKAQSKGCCSIHSQACQNHRTNKDPYRPWEQSREEEYAVVAVSAKEYRAGQPYYLVEWEGDFDDTWEPEANLVTATDVVKHFNDELKKAMARARGFLI